jgi:hypothetical protein
MRWDEGDVSAFLDVQIQKDTSTKTVHLTQPGLIEQVLKDVGIHKLSTKKLTPADNILHPDPECADCIETWNDWCMIGKLNYIANNTRTDISIAMHQSDHYCSNLKSLHELAVKRIICHLLAIKNKRSHFKTDFNSRPRYVHWKRCFWMMA